MAEVLRLQRLVEQLKRKSAASKKEVDGVSAVVGYTQSYAIYVHENMQAHHPVGQAKFLEQPFRELRNNATIRILIMNALHAGKTFAQSLLIAALRIQRESQKIVPVDTGALKNSAFTRLEIKG